jgi:class 3 adenylate cyclase/tetratricopeptide (TPR) repeat protein
MKILRIYILLVVSLPIVAQSQLDSLYHLLEKGNDSVKVAAYQDISRSLYQMGEVDSSINTCGRALAFIKNTGEPEKYKRPKANLYSGLAVCYYRQSDMAQTIALLDSSLHYYTLIRDTAKMHSIIGMRGAVADFQGKNDLAIASYKKVYDYYKSISDTSGQLSYLFNLASIYKRQQGYDEAAEMYRAGLEMAINSKYYGHIGKAYKGLGDIFYFQGLYNQSLENYNRSISFFERADSWNQLLNVKANRAMVYKAQKEYEAALKTYREVLRASIKMGKEKGIASDYLAIGEIYELYGNLDSALWYFSKALSISKRIGYPRGLASSQGQMARVYYEQGNFDLAETLAREAIESFREQKNENAEWMTANILARILIKRGQLKKASELADQAFSKGKELAILSLQESSARIQYELYKRQRQYALAVEKLELADILQDSLQNEEIREMAIRSDLEYTYHQESLQDSLAAAEERYELSLAYNQEIQAQRQRVNWTIAAGGLVLLISMGLFSRVRYVQKARIKIQKEKERSDNLLLNILPADIAEELKEKGKADARDFDLVSILFTDFKGFTEQSAKLSAAELVNEINYCFKAFDGIMEKYGIEKIKTIGDAYMAAGGLPVPTDDSVKNTVLAALEMQAYIVQRHQYKVQRGEPAFEMRVGIHTGPVVAGIVGVKKFQYDIWGDTVNTASRMESAGEVGKVNISQATYELLKDTSTPLGAGSQFEFKSRGKIEAKGKGEMEMYFVTKKANPYDHA